MKMSGSYEPFFWKATLLRSLSHWILCFVAFAVDSKPIFSRSSCFCGIAILYLLKYDCEAPEGFRVLRDQKWISSINPNSLFCLI